MDETFKYVGLRDQIDSERIDQILSINTRQIDYNSYDDLNDRILAQSLEKRLEVKGRTWNDAFSDRRKEMRVLFDIPRDRIIGFTLTGGPFRSIMLEIAGCPFEEFKGLQESKDATRVQLILSRPTFLDATCRYRGIRLTVNPVSGNTEIVKLHLELARDAENPFKDMDGTFPPYEIKYLRL